MPDETQISEINARFEDASPQEILRWVLLESDFERVAVASAFQREGTAIIHMAQRIRPGVPILFLETGFHFAETLAFKERLTELLGLNVVDLTGDHTVESQAQAFAAASRAVAPRGLTPSLTEGLCRVARARSTI